MVSLIFILLIVVGERCQTANPCFNETCNDRGTCINVPTTTLSAYEDGYQAFAQCQCNEGYSGKHCEEVGNNLLKHIGS